MRAALSAALVLALAGPVAAQPKAATLTPQEIADGWLMLFDGETTFGWGKAGNPQVKDGCLTYSGGDKGAEVWYPFGLPDEYEIKADWYREGRAFFLTRNQRALFALLPTKDAPSGFHKWSRIDGGLVWEYRFRVDSEPMGFGSWFEDGKPEKARIGFKLEPNSQVVIRKLWFRPLKSASLFNGKDLTGWTVFADPKRAATKFEVTKDGELSAKNGPGDLQTEKTFGNFLFQTECKTNGKWLNSGVFFRCMPGQYQNGYEAQIQNAYVGDDRAKPLDFGTGAIYRRVASRKIVSNDHEWFTLTVLADGPHIATWVNGYQTVDWTDDRPPNDNPRQGLRTAAGHLSLQGHDPTTDLLFRRLRIAEFGAGEKRD